MLLRATVTPAHSPAELIDGAADCDWLRRTNALRFDIKSIIPLLVFVNQNSSRVVPIAARGPRLTTTDSDQWNRV